MGRSVTPIPEQMAELTVLTGAMGLLNGNDLALYKYGFTPDPASTLAEMNAQICDFTNFTVLSLASWKLAGTNVNGLVVAPSLALQWYHLGVPVVSNTVGGYFVRNSGNTAWRFAVPFSQPVIMGVTGYEQLLVVAEKHFRPQGNISNLAFQIAQLEALTVAMGRLDAAIVRLYQEGYTPTESSTMADLDAVEADYDGYAEAAIVDWNEAGTDDDGEVIITADSTQFIPTGVTTPNSIGGYYVVDSTGATLKFAVPFDSPQVIGVTGFEQIVVEATKTYGR